MKRILLTVAALALTTSPAFGQAGPSAYSEVKIAGEVGALCGVGAAKHTMGTPQGVAQTVAEDTLTIPQLIDSNGWLVASTHTINFGNMWCNSTNPTIAVSFSPLRRIGATSDAAQDANSFTNRINFELEYGMVTGSTATLPADAPSGVVLAATPLGQAFETGGGAVAEAQVRILAPAYTNNQRPVAGPYEGWVRVTLATAP